MSSSSFSTEDLDPSIQPTPDPTLERLVSASSSGNLPSVEATFEEWKSSQDPVARASSQAPNYAMQPALEAAALKSHLDIIAYFLAEGFHITEEVVRNAIRAPSIAALELFLDHGWHINRRRPRCRQPAIRYTAPSPAYPLCRCTGGCPSTRSVRHVFLSELCRHTPRLLIYT